MSRSCHSATFSSAGVTALLYLDQRIRREGLDVALYQAAQAAGVSPEGAAEAGPEAAAGDRQGGQAGRVREAGAGWRRRGGWGRRQERGNRSADD